MSAPAWRSPRKDAKTAVQLGGRWIDEYEMYLSRPLTPAEMAEVHGNARHVAAHQGQQARAAADRADVQDDMAEAELSI